MQSAFSRVVVTFVILGLSGTGNVAISQVGLTSDVRVGWLKKNAVSVRTIDPRDQEFSDLMALKRSIGNARIVMLGESSHGEGGTALGKTRLVEFLHQKMGFDVLVFEGGLYDMTKVWGSLQKGDATVPSLRQGVMAAWSGSDQSQNVFDYIAANANKKHPIEIAGFDSQVTGSASRKYLIQDLAAFLKEAGIKSDLVIEGSSTRSIFEDVLASKYFRGTPVPNAAAQKSYLSALEQLEDEISSNASADKLRKGFWIQELRTLRTFSHQIWQTAELKDKAPQWEIGAERERQAAENMLWLANERYRGHKLIVWAATFHLFRNKGLELSQCIDPKDVDFCKQVSMGERVWDKLGRDVYTIGFTAYGGNTGFVVDGKPAEEWTGPLKQDQHESIEMEELLNAAGFNYGFLDLRRAREGGEWLKTPIMSRPLGNKAALRNWSEALDALFFLREQQFDTRKAF